MIESNHTRASPSYVLQERTRQRCRRKGMFDCQHPLTWNSRGRGLGRWLAPTRTKQKKNPNDRVRIARTFDLVSLAEKLVFCKSIFEFPQWGGCRHLWKPRLAERHLSSSSESVNYTVRPSHGAWPWRGVFGVFEVYSTIFREEKYGDRFCRTISLWSPLRQVIKWL